MAPRNNLFVSVGSMPVWLLTSKVRLVQIPIYLLAPSHDSQASLIVCCPSPWQDTIVYALHGRGTVVSGGGKKRQDHSLGDFALIPAWAEHLEVNDVNEEVTCVITRSNLP